MVEAYLNLKTTATENIVFMVNKAVTASKKTIKEHLYGETWYTKVEIFPGWAENLKNEVSSKSKFEY